MWRSDALKTRVLELNPHFTNVFDYKLPHSDRPPRSHSPAFSRTRERFDVGILEIGETSIATPVFTQKRKGAAGGGGGEAMGSGRVSHLGPRGQLAHALNFLTAFPPTHSSFTARLGQPSPHSPTHWQARVSGGSSVLGFTMYKFLKVEI